MEVHFTPFYLFGMGARRKLVYKSGVLSDALNGSELRKWDVKSQKIVPSEYSVFITCGNGREVIAFENEGGVYIQENDAAEAVTERPVCLPRFEGTGHAAEMRALHQEILIHIIDGKPLPNFFVYKKPWYRDSAMMCMCLKKTNNLHVGVLGFDARTNALYPYLAWAEAHFHQAPFPSMPDVSRYPLTWEAEASQADYSGIGGVCEEYERRKVAAPHTWHAAEAFLYLLEGVC